MYCMAMFPSGLRTRNALALSRAEKAFDHGSANQLLIYFRPVDEAFQRLIPHLNMALLLLFYRENAPHPHPVDIRRLQLSHADLSGLLLNDRKSFLHSLTRMLP